jgi:hypothetical protein
MLIWRVRKALRKYQQKQILNMINTLDEAHAEVERLFSMGNYEPVLTLLSDAHELADHIIGIITDIKDPNTQTAAALAQIMETIRSAFEEIDKSIEDKIKPSNEFIKAWHRLNMKADILAKTELKPDRLEMIFLPYKASMWDSLESVWMEAKDDPACDVYVIPIPYFEMKKDLKPEDLAYDGDKYPEYVPITDYKKYDLEARHPDIIIIHNPYDNRNFVTSVLPRYYAEKIYEYTDMLVYVPYFVSFDDVPEHFCLIPGTIYSDRVFVQSEKVRQTYIRVFGKWLKRIGGITKNGRTWEKVADLERKFQAIGSPKFDKVMNFKEDDFELPDEWRKLVYKDSVKKPVVFYNVGFTMLTAGAESKLARLKYAIELFKKQDKVMLWWRPHPLNMETLKTMRPRYYEEYSNLVEEYRRGGWGIYDDTPDLHRAIAMSEAYYGDWSSIVSLFGAAGKPAMVQNANILDDGRQEGSSLAGFKPANILEAPGAYWFTDRTINGLFKIERETGSVEYMCGFPGFGLRGISAFSSIAICEDRVYLAPFAAKGIGVYDTKTRKFQSLPVPERENPADMPYHANETAALFTQIISANGLLYFIPGSYPGILVCEPVSNRIEIIDDWLDKVKYFPNVRGQWFSAAVFDKERGCIALLCSGGGMLIEVDLNTRTTRLRHVGCGETYIDIATANGFYWLLMEERAGIARLNPVSGEAVSYVPQIADPSFDKDEAFQAIVEMRDPRFLTLINNKMPLKFDTLNNEFALLNDFNIKYEDYTIIRTSANNKVMLCEKSTGVIVSIDPSSGVSGEIRIKPHHVKNPEEIRKAIFNIGTGEIDTLNGCIVTENLCGVRLEDMINALVAQDEPEWMSQLKQRQTELYSSKIKNLDGSAGKAIYDICKNTAIGPTGG